MDQEIEKIIADQMKNLPKDVLAAIVSVDYKTKLQEITKRQKLLIDQAAKLEMETTLVMIGLEPLADYVGNLQREMEIPIVRAKEISLDVSENIFKPIRESLRAMNEVGDEDTRSADEIIAEMSTQEAGASVPEESGLDRDQILSEIEDPSLIDMGSQVPVPPVASSKMEIETLDEVPYQQDIKIRLEKENKINTVPENIVPKSSLLETKLAGITITPQQIVTAEPEIKLPAVEKKRPSSGFDPYREEIK